MTPADRAEIVWMEQDRKKRGWQIRLWVGEEVIKYRPPEPAPGREADEELLRSATVEAARLDGFELNPDAVTIHRP
ncbi:MAG TPA: hypothetical protein VFA33_23530 [Bryobacteraceae bacterium]|nr:hypothetical protein [Bryobacteraceae bacterium]